MVTHRAAKTARGFTGGNSVDMIDDDFESVFRRMVEHFMGSMGIPDGNVEVRTWSNRFPKSGTPADTTPHEVGPEVEEIDLGDEYMILVDTRSESRPSVVIEDGQVRVELDSGFEPKSVPLPFGVDIPSSSASFQNGILEVLLRKAAGDYDGESEGVLQIE